MESMSSSTKQEADTFALTQNQDGFNSYHVQDFLVNILNERNLTVQDFLPLTNNAGAST